jgi:hypothetical protein
MRVRAAVSTMPMKKTGTADLEVVDRFEGGVGWIAYPEEAMQRASHAVVSENDLWVFDPVDAPAVDDLLGELDADVGGIVVGLARHERDAAAVANRHDVPVYVPAWMDGVAEGLDAPVARFDHELAGFSVERLIDTPLWQEAVFFDGATLVVPEALGTVAYFRSAGEDLGVHPMLRVLPPRSLRQYAPERLLVGHGEGRFEDVPGAIREAVDGSRRRAPALYLRNLRSVLPL